MRVYLDPNNAELKAKYDELFAQIARETNKTVVDLPTYFDALENIKMGSQKYNYPFNFKIKALIHLILIPEH